MDRITSENEEETEKKMGRLEKRLQEMERNATSTGLRAPMDVVRNGRWSVGARGRCLQRSWAPAGRGPGLITINFDKNHHNVLPNKKDSKKENFFFILYIKYPLSF